MENIFAGWEVSGKDPLLWFALSIQKDMYIYICIFILQILTIFMRLGCPECPSI